MHHRPTVFENHRKSRIQHCKRSKLRLHFECPPKMVENTNIEKIQMGHLGKFSNNVAAGDHVIMSATFREMM